MRHGVFIMVFLSFWVGLFAWVGSNAKVGITFPDGEMDTSNVKFPITVKGFCWNAEQGIDYYDLYLFPDTDSDGVIDSEEWAKRVRVRHQEDFNQVNIYNANLSERYEVDTHIVSQTGQFTGYFFLFITARDLNGDVWPDTNIVGLTADGDSTHPDTTIARFYGRW